MKLIFARHGETEWNSKKKVQGWKNSKLTPKGVRQTKAVAKMLKGTQIDFIYSSDLGRAYQTALEIVKFHPELKVEKVKWAREISYGKAEGMTRAEIDKKFPDFWHQRTVDRYNFSIAGAENYKKLEKRALPNLEKLIHKHNGQTVLIVGHANINRVMIAYLLNMAKAEMELVRIPHECIYFVDMDNFTSIEYQLPNKPIKPGYLKIENPEVWKL